MQITFQALTEFEPGRKWQQQFNRNWPAYKRWFLSRGDADQPDLSVSVKQLRRFMPELMPTYERLTALAGGDELAARVLSFYRPPAYLMGCSQAVWSKSGSAFLIRNYDLDPALNEGVILHSAWNGRRVIAANECLWGASDGINDAGLTVSLTFGGRKVVGDGFGIPVIVRYVLEFCDTAAEAIEVLRRVPSHMAYNVTVLDRGGHYATIRVSPDRPVTVTQEPVATNHQGPIECPEHARFTRTVERERFLREQLADTQVNEQSFIDAFLRAPLYSTDYKNAFGTLYTAVYRPAQGIAEYRWPDGVWVQSFDRFLDGKRVVQYSDRADTPPDTAWELDDFNLSTILGQVSKTVFDALDKTGDSPAKGLVDELIEEFDRTGHFRWEKIAAIWTTHASRSR